MASIRQHRLRWKATVRIPKALEEANGGRKYRYRNLTTTDRRAAQIEADAWELSLRLEWAEALGREAPSRTTLREMYGTLLGQATDGEFLLYGRAEDDAVEAGIDHEIERMAERIGQREPTATEATTLAALQDALRIRNGQKVPRRRELEATFRDLADDYMAAWRADASLKESNTEQQKIATFDLFASYWGEKPLRDVRKANAAGFVDALRRLNPLWGRSPLAKKSKLVWDELQRTFGNHTPGLSDATVNRHMATLSSFWKWGQERDHCEGNNPFTGFHKKLKQGRNVQGYLAWDNDELQRLFDPPPKRSDLTEIMLVAMYTGMRLDEIASLTFGQLKTSSGVAFIQVEDAKTPAGTRKVPLHSKLGWLAARQEKAEAGARVWPGFNAEGPGKKPGADAGKEFSRLKLARGFTERTKVFHSFRKNVVGQLEALSVPQSEVAQLVGHEKGFTFGKYGAGVSLKRLAEIVALIEYPEAVLPCLAPLAADTHGSP